MGQNNTYHRQSNYSPITTKYVEHGVGNESGYGAMYTTGNNLESRQPYTTYNLTLNPFQSTAPNMETQPGSGEAAQHGHTNHQHIPVKCTQSGVGNDSWIGKMFATRSSTTNIFWSNTPNMVRIHIRRCIQRTLQIASDCILYMSYSLVLTLQHEPYYIYIYSPVDVCVS